MKYKYVKDLMTSPAITCEKSATIKQAIDLLKEKNIGFLPIVSNNIIVGVVTDRDILLRGIGIYKLNSKIDKVMTQGDIFFVSPETELIEAAKMMSDNKIRRLVVLNDGLVHGIITSKNILKEPSLLPYIAQTYLANSTIKEYSLFYNGNPQDSIKASDYPL